MQEAEGKKKRVKDEHLHADLKSFNIYKADVTKKHKNVAEERKQWLNTVKVNAREELRRLSH